jgi:hypothetical protein
MIQKDLDIAEYTDAQHNAMIPHTIVLDPGLIIFSSTTATSSSVAQRKNSVSIVRAVLKGCRVDWDIITPHES